MMVVKAPSLVRAQAATPGSAIRQFETFENTDELICNVDHPYPYVASEVSIPKLLVGRPEV